MPAGGRALALPAAAAVGLGALGAAFAGPAAVPLAAAAFGLGLWAARRTAPPPPAPLAPAPPPGPVSVPPEALSDAERRARREIAHILHNGIQPALAGARLLLSTPGGLPEADAAVEQALQQARALSHALDARNVARPLVPTLRVLAAHHQRWHRLDLRAALPSDDDPNFTLAPAVVEAAAAITTEALFNASRHATGAPVELRVAPAAAWILLHIDDAGPGFDPASAQSGGGTCAMAWRAASVGAQLDLWARPGAGTHLTLALPRPPPG